PAHNDVPVIVFKRAGEHVVLLVDKEALGNTSEADQALVAQIEENGYQLLPAVLVLLGCDAVQVKKIDVIRLQCREAALHTSPELLGVDQVSGPGWGGARRVGHSLGRYDDLVARPLHGSGDDRLGAIGSRGIEQIDTFVDSCPDERNRVLEICASRLAKPAFSAGPEGRDAHLKPRAAQSHLLHQVSPDRTVSSASPTPRSRASRVSAST